MKVTVELPRPVAAALLRFQIQKGFSTSAAAVAYIVTHALADYGWF